MGVACSSTPGGPRQANDHTRQHNTHQFVLLEHDYGTGSFPGLFQNLWLVVSFGASHRVIQSNEYWRFALNLAIKLLPMNS